MGELLIRIDITVRDKIMLIDHPFILECQESGGRQILDINKGDPLWCITRREVESGLDTFNLHEIIFLARAVYSCRA